MEKMKMELMESHKREAALNQDIRSMAKLLKDTQTNLKLLNDKVGHLSVSAKKDCKKEESLRRGRD